MVAHIRFLMEQDKFKDVKTIFVDLDDTIWDFTANSKVALRRTFESYGLQSQCPFERFAGSYMPNNERLWTLYHHGRITRDFLKAERFRVSFEECGIRFDDSGIPERFDHDYLENIVVLDRTVDGARELLSHLRKRGEIHVLSNGFKDLQYRKLKSARLDGYISKIVLSDDIGVTKPDKRLFDYALTVTGGDAATSLMIGDNYDADILGAHGAGWRTVFFNRKGMRPNPNVADLTVEKLADILPWL